MAFSLQAPPVTEDINEIYQWCFRLWEWLQVPERPCFLVNPASDQEDITADGGWINIVWGTEIFDIDGNFASNEFTAPITGKYLFSCFLQLNNVDTAADYYGAALVASNRTIILDIFDPGQFAGDVPFWRLGGSVTVDMDAGDTAIVRIIQVAGSSQTDIDTNSNFSGVLVAR